MSTRFTKDAAFVVTKALPAAAGSNTSTSFDLQAVDASFEKIELEISVPALPSLADTKNLTITIKDSADNVTFAAIPELATFVRLGASGAGAVAAVRQVRLPSSTRRYIRFDQAVDSAGGDSTAKSTTMSLLF